MIRKYKDWPPVSIVIAHRNSSSTVLYTLEGIKKQKYPILETIIVDNGSIDNSLDLIEKFSTRNKSLNIKIIKKEKNTGQSNSFNMGVKRAKSNHVILMQADGVLPSKLELKKIMAPALKESNIAACSEITLMPKYVWNKYNFWEKCMFSGSVNRAMRGFNSKFDYVNRQTYLKAGGYDEVNFNSGVGGEDADFTMRIKKIGRVVETNARVVHLHYIGDNYSIKDWILNRKLFGRTYGRIIRMHGFNLPIDTSVLLIKPALAFASFIPSFFPYNILVMIAFSFLYMRVMYITKQTLLDPHIILLPFIALALIYYETFWMLEQFFTPVKYWKGVK